MADVVVTLVLSTEDPDVTPIVDAAIAAAEAEGQVVTSARVTTDAGETVVDVPPPDETGGTGNGGTPTTTPPATSTTKGSK